MAGLWEGGEGALRVTLTRSFGLSRSIPPSHPALHTLARSLPCSLAPRKEGWTDGQTYGRTEREGEEVLREGGTEGRRGRGREGGVCEQGFYKARVDSEARVRRPVESDPRLRGSGPMSDGPG